MNLYGGRVPTTFGPTRSPKACRHGRGDACQRVPVPKGERLYDWALTLSWRLQITTEERRFEHYLMVRRSLDEKREHAYYVVYAPRSKTTRQTLVNVAGRRWEIETGFEATKGECGVDE